MYYNERLNKYVDVKESTPLPVQIMDGRETPSEDETVTVNVTRNANGDTTKVVEHSSLTDRTVTTNFIYTDET